MDEPVKAQDYAVGLPEKGNLGDPVTALRPGDTVEYVAQHHTTARNPTRPHVDLRLGSASHGGMYSWALPKGRLPEAGEKILAAQTEIHRPSYNTFEGRLGKGYGEGMVKRLDLGKAVITKTNPGSIHFTVAHSRVPTRYVLIRTQGRNWLLMGKPEAKDVPGVGDKPVYKEIKAPDLDSALEQATQVQAKIDGAHSLLNVGPKGEVGTFSVRPSVEGRPIQHTERAGLHGRTVPSQRDTTARGEMYYTDAEGKAIPFQAVSGLLNKNIAGSLEQQRTQKLKPRMALFDLIRYQGKPVTDMPYAERQQLLKEFHQSVAKDLGDVVHLPVTAEGPEKRKLVESIREGKEPTTQEGVMLVMPDGRIMKSKNKEESTGYLAGTFTGEGKRKGTAGGLTYATEPGGEPTGRIGTGFSDEELKDIVDNLKQYIGRPIRVEHMGQFSSGKHRAPSFAGFETDKSAQASVPAPKPALASSMLQPTRPSRALPTTIASTGTLPSGQHMVSTLPDGYGDPDQSNAKTLMKDKLKTMATQAVAGMFGTNVARKAQGVSVGLKLPGMGDKEFAADVSYKGKWGGPGTQRTPHWQVDDAEAQRLAQPAIKTNAAMNPRVLAAIRRKDYAALREFGRHGGAVRGEQISRQAARDELSRTLSRERTPESAFYRSLKDPGTAANHEAGTKLASPAADLAKAEKSVDTAPTDAQKDSGNYRKGHLTLQGLQITIENPKGSYRSGTSKSGKKWRTLMNASYGYIRGVT